MTSSKLFDSLHVTGLQLISADDTPGFAAPPFERATTSFLCSVVHSLLNEAPRYAVQFTWTAPPRGTGCVSFR